MLKSKIKETIEPIKLYEEEESEKFIDIVDHDDILQKRFYEFFNERNNNGEIVLLDRTIRNYTI